MKRLLFFFLGCLIMLPAVAEDEHPAIHIFYKDSTIVSFLKEQVDSISYIAQEENPFDIQIQRIHMKDSINDIIIEDVDSIVFTPPSYSYFWWATTGLTHKKTHTSAVLEGMAEGAIKSGDKIETGFYISEKGIPNKEKDSWWFKCGNLFGDFEKEVTSADGFVGGKSYKYQAYVSVNGIKHYGGIRHFELQHVSVVTHSSPKVEKSENYEYKYKALVEGDILHGHKDEIRAKGTVGFLYSTEDNPEIDLPNVKRVEGQYNEIGDFTATLDNLDFGTKYYYRAFVEIANTIYYGKTLSFGTPDKVMVTTREATDVGAASANLPYEVDMKMYDVLLKSGMDGIQYGYTADLDQLDESSYHILHNWYPDTEAHYSYVIPFTMLQPTTTYYYRAFAILDGERYYGNTQQFTTKEITVITYDAYDVLSTTACIEGEIMDKDAIIKGDVYGFYYSTTGDPAIDYDAKKIQKAFESGDNGRFKWTSTNLVPGTTYYCRAFVTYRNKVYLGNLKSFTTEDIGFIGELGLFELKGRVKSCTTNTIWGFTNTRTFNEYGMWQTYNGTKISSIYDYGISRDDYGRIIEGDYEGGGESFAYDEKGRITTYEEIYYDGGESHTYTYDNNDLLIKMHVEMLGMDAWYNDDYDETYSDYTFDSYGNWVSRIVHNPYVGSATETRKITYYK